jgi:hypothetical protein
VRGARGARHHRKVSGAVLSGADSLNIFERVRALAAHSRRLPTPAHWRRLPALAHSRRLPAPARDGGL